MANDGSPQEIRIEFCENYANGDTKQRVIFMIELINRIATGRTTLDDAAALDHGGE